MIFLRLEERRQEDSGWSLKSSSQANTFLYFCVGWAWDAGFAGSSSEGGLLVADFSLKWDIVDGVDDAARREGL